MVPVPRRFQHSRLCGRRCGIESARGEPSGADVACSQFITRPRLRPDCHARATLWHFSLPARSQRGSFENCTKSAHLSHRMPMPSTKPILKLLDLIQSHRVTAVIYVAAKLGIAELLRDGPQTLDELAK